MLCASVPRGWCTENGAKASEGSKEAKEAKGAKSAKSAKGAKGAKAKSPHCATMDGPRCAAEPACRWEKSWIDAGCRGDGSRWQNPGARIHHAVAWSISKAAEVYAGELLPLCFGVWTSGSTVRLQLHQRCRGTANKGRD